MENMFYNISQVLGLTIINSLWQGLLIYFMLRVIFMFSNNLSSSKKYVLAYSSLLAITVWFLCTLIKQIYLFNWLATVPAKLPASPLLLTLPAGINQVDGESLRYYYNIEGLLPYIAAIYLLGLVFNTFRIISANKKLNIIRKAAIIDLALQQQVKKFAERLGIGKQVSIGLSNMVAVPCMTGYIKPMILLPFTLQTYLSASEIEAIMLHELAHIKRNDYLLNILQQVIAILLFFNPCAQLISKMINEERENSCDDLVVKAEAEPITYAKALLKLAQNSQSDRQLALAATGKKYHLLNRIERIMKTKQQKTSTRPALLAMLIFTLSIGAVALLNPQMAQGKISIKAIRPVIDSMLADTGKKQVATKPHAKAKYIAKHKHAADEHFDDAKVNELNAKIQQSSNAISEYYSSQDFKDIQSKIEALKDRIQAYYDDPAIKRLQDEIAKVNENSKGLYNDAKLQAISAQLGEKGREIGAYYSSPEFVKINKELRKKYGIPEGQDTGDDKDDNYKKYQAELATHIPAKIKLTQDEIEKLGKHMSNFYDNPAIQANNKHMQEISDSLRVLYYDNPQIKAQQKEIEQLSQEMSNYDNNPEIKKQQKLLAQYAKEIAAYLSSAAYKNAMKQVMSYKMDYKYDYDKSYNNDKSTKNDDQDKSDNQ